MTMTNNILKEDDGKNVEKFIRATTDDCSTVLRVVSSS